MNQKPSKLAIWQEHIKNCEASGLSQKDYCSQNKLSLAQMGYWRRRLRSLAKKNQASEAQSGFVAIPISSTRADRLTLTLPSGINISGFHSTQDLVELVKALR